jgi:hypothetical protein
VPRLQEARLDPSVLLFIIGLAFASSLLFGTIPPAC